MSKDNIKKILRESDVTNALGFMITKPNQELIILRGIPGSGKSTKAKELVGNGQIFSTDDRIESQGNYREFFNSMISSGDFSPLSKMHSLNFKMAKDAMKSGVTPVIIDNTNIKANEPKNYVEAALSMGYSDDNIKIVDIGTGGLSAEELADRNTHGVPLDKIKSMIQSHKSVGPLTLEKIIKAKNMYKPKTSKFASVVLDDKSRKNLLDSVMGMVDMSGWEIIAHHMTINFGKGLPEDLKGDLGKTVNLTASHLGVSDKAIAVKVEGYHSDNKIPHITIAVNRKEGGKPVMSNDIQDWNKLPTYINLSGVVSEENLK